MYQLERFSLTLVWVVKRPVFLMSYTNLFEIFEGYVTKTILKHTQVTF